MYSIFLFFLFFPNKASKVAKGKLEYLATLAYQGFYCFEAITTRNLDNVICGTCRIIGEVYLENGNEKNCCVNNRMGSGFPSTFAQLVYIIQAKPDNGIFKQK